MKFIKVNWLNVDAILLLACVFAVAAARADEDSGGYFGVALGRVSLSDYCSNTAGLVVTSCDHIDTSYKMFGGYRFTPNIAFELAYVGLGDYPATVVSAGTPVNVRVSVSGVTAQAAGIVPFGEEFSMMGRIGAIFWNVDSSAVAAGSLVASGFNRQNSGSGVDFALGVSAQYKFLRFFGIRADLDYYPNLGDGDTGQDNVTAASIGMVFLF